MYLPKHFEFSDPVRLREFMWAHPLATLVVADASGLSADHIPLQVTGDDASGWKLAGHVARANPLWKKAEAGIDCLAIFHGPQHYISPNWYATKKENGKVVPTWNYEVVHVQGRLRTVDDVEWLRDFLQRLTETHEADQPKPWQLDDAPEEYLQRMLQAVVGIEIEIVTMIGKAKVSQNQPKSNQESLIAALHQTGNPQSIEMADKIEGWKTTHSGD
jgi:transcriptional regulator